MVISYPSIFSRTVKNVVQQVFGSMITSWTNKKKKKKKKLRLYRAPSHSEGTSISCSACVFNV